MILKPNDEILIKSQNRPIFVQTEELYLFSELSEEIQAETVEDLYQEEKSFQLTYLFDDDFIEEGMQEIINDFIDHPRCRDLWIAAIEDHSFNNGPHEWVYEIDRNHLDFIYVSGEFIGLEFHSPVSLYPEELREKLKTFVFETIEKRTPKRENIQKRCENMGYVWDTEGVPIGDENE